MRHSAPRPALVFGGLVPVLVSAFLLSACSEGSQRVVSAASPHPQNSEAKLVAASATAVAPSSPVPDPPVPPPGTVLHQVKKGESLPALVHRYLPQTSFMTGRELDAAIRAANGNRKGNNVKPAEYVVIPGIESNWEEKPVALPKDFEVRAIYLTGLMAGGEHGLSIVQRWRAAGGNTIVFDIKDSDGSLSIPFDHPLAPRARYYPIRNLAKYTRYLHSQGMHAIARIAIFRDEQMVTNHPQLAIQSRRLHQAWRENSKLVWTDPSRPEVQDYNIALAKYAAQAGADEIQFDYVRFPAEGDQPDAQFAYETVHPQWKRADVITDFLRKAQAEIRPTGALFSLDVFGVMAWQRPVDLSHTGQDIPAMAKFCDVLSPMIYPSHFYGMDGYALPGDAPAHFISESMAKFAKITAGTGVVLRPWLQAFGWRTKTYSPEYIRTQVKVAKENGGIGFLFWNARNDYAKPYVAMPDMRSAKGQYFRGDEVKNADRPVLKSTSASSSTL